MIINPYAFGPSYDPDAQAFITAAVITNTSQQVAINNLVLSLKSYGVWSKMKAIYPFIGGSASSHKWNLKDPRDLNAAFRLVFNGGWTHTAQGVQPNGTNGWANTFYNLSTNSTNTNVSAGVYNRTNTLNTNTISYGAESGSSNFAGTTLGLKLTDGLTYYATNDNLGNAAFGSVTDVRGFFAQTISSISNTIKQIYRNGSLISNSVRAQIAAPNLEIAFGANNRAGVIQFYDSKQSSFLFFGDTLTSTDVANSYTAIQAFQVALGRSVGTQTVSDADAQAFVTAANIDDQVQSNAVNQLVIDMKAANIWTKMKAIYPFVGGTATSHKWNLKNPLDTNAAFRLSFVGGWTHDANGITGNGTNNFANTFLIPNTDLLLNSTHISAYTRSNISVNAPLLSSENTSTYDNGLYIWARQVGILLNSVRINDNTSSGGSSPADIRGLHIATRTASNVKNYRFNQTQQFSLNVASSAGNTSSIYLGASRNNANYNSSNLAFSTVGEGLSNSECDNLYTAVQNFNTTLGRQVV